MFLFLGARAGQHTCSLKSALCFRRAPIFLQKAGKKDFRFNPWRKYYFGMNVKTHKLKEVLRESRLNDAVGQGSNENPFTERSGVKD